MKDGYSTSRLVVVEHRVPSFVTPDFLPLGRENSVVRYGAGSSESGIF